MRQWSLFAISRLPPQISGGEYENSYYVLCVKASLQNSSSVYSWAHLNFHLRRGVDISHRAFLSLRLHLGPG